MQAVKAVQKDKYTRGQVYMFPGQSWWCMGLLWLGHSSSRSWQADSLAAGVFVGCMCKRAFTAALTS
jgi:hypothetical protein